MKFFLGGSPRQQQLVRSCSGSELDGHCQWQSFWMTKTSSISEQSPELQERSRNVPIQVSNQPPWPLASYCWSGAQPARLGRSATANVTGIWHGEISALSSQKPENVQELELALRAVHDRHTFPVFSSRTRYFLWIFRGWLISIKYSLEVMGSGKVCESVWAVLLQKQVRVLEWRGTICS